MTLLIGEDKHLLLLMPCTITPGPRSTPRRLNADPIAVDTTRTPLSERVVQTWRPCSRRHRGYVLAGALPISCSRCTHTQEDE